ncbi:MAG: hypothetical protein WCM93_05795 [Bacteroidota bacterium]
MYRVFNMGHRMDLYVPAEIAAEIIAIAQCFSVEARIVGYCETASAKKLRIISGEEKYSYFA